MNSVCISLSALVSSWLIPKRSVHTQPAYAAIRKNIESDMRRQTRIHHLIEIMTGVRLKLCAREHGFPRELGIFERLKRHVRRVATLERTTLGKVSFEPRRVNFESPHASGRSQPHDRPIMSRSATPLCFP